MRKIFTLLSLFLSLGLSAQENSDTMFVYCNDGTIERISIERIDSVTFVSPSAATENPDVVVPETPSAGTAIDLGLPSGLKWASCNVGATSPEEYGGYYAWGETEEKDDYSWATYKWYNGTYDSQTKYCTDSSYGTVDNKTVLDPEDDVAHVKWGGDWRMPTRAEQDELRTECTWTWTTLNGINGYQVTGPNGNSIFLPAAGYRYGTNVNSRGSYGGYWSASLYSYDSNYAYNLHFGSGYFDWGSYYRYYGFTVRPVYDTPVATYTVSVSGSDGGSVAIEGATESSTTLESGNSVTVVATADTNFEFLGWFIGDSETAESTVATYTFTVNENVELVAKFKDNRMVDLGLPSGLKWASCNVGATAPEEYGGYYAWGETEEKDDYSWATYKWCNGTSDTMTKYCTDSSYGTVDNKTVLDLEDDVAHVKWGGDWRMPTRAEQDELRTECTWTWTTLNGINGYQVTGPNGNSIFLPAAGTRSGTNVGRQGSYGYCWSASLYSDTSYDAYSLRFSSGGYDWGYSYRYDGRTVRPVCE